MNREQRRKHQPKVNPRKIQRTQQDVDRARGEGIETGVKCAFQIALYILLDKHNAPVEECQQLNNEMTRAAEQILDKKLSWSFIEKVLEENGIGEVKFCG